jgi:hypothetical protein
MSNLVLTLFKLFNCLNADLNSIYYLLALLGAHTILHVSRMRVNGRLWRGGQTVRLVTRFYLDSKLIGCVFRYRVSFKLHMMPGLGYG